MTFIIVLIGWVFTVCVHEFSHALIAYLGGDYTVREKGYLTFNPLKYTHPVYSLLLPIVFLVIGGFGLPGGAVYIETWRLKSPRWVSAVSLAGPISNLILAIVLAVILQFAPPIAIGIWPALAFLALLQVTAALFNLIPLPPFDGYGAIEPYLPHDIRSKVAETRGAFIWIVFLVFWYVPFISDAFWGLVFFIASLLQIPPILVAAGYSGFFFWK
jgi:Zn-dependent protease